MKKCCKIEQITVEGRRREIELTDKFEIKIFILYLLKNIKEPLEFSTINDIVVQDGFVNYFDFAICFAELLESNQITELKGDKTLYVISAAGTEAVESVEDKIFVSVKEKALRSALRLLAFNRSGSRTRSRVEKAEKGYNLLDRGQRKDPAARRGFPDRRQLCRKAAHQLRRARRNHLQGRAQPAFGGSEFFVR